MPEDDPPAVEPTRVSPDEVLSRYLAAAGRAAAASLPLGGSWLAGARSALGPAEERLHDPLGPLPPRGLAATIGDWDAQRDLAWIVGLVLRGWRKGLDAEAGATLGSGVAAPDDLAWWCEQAVQAAGRRLP